MTTKKLPKIAIIHPSVSWYRLPLFRQLARIHRNTVVLFTQSNILPIYSRRKVRVIKPKGFTFKLFPSYRLLPPPYPQEVTPSIIIELIKGRYDVVLWGEALTSIEILFAFLICKILRKPLILWVDEWGMPKPLLRRFIEPVIKLIITRSSSVIAHGKRHYEYFRKLGVKKSNIFTTGSVSWITPTKEDHKIASTLSRKFEGKKILYVGGLIERKGVQYLIKAFAKLARENEDLYLWVVGDGSEKNSLMDLARKLRIERKVNFFGWVSHSEIAPYFLAADMLVLPSWNEPWGLVINEAMSVGKPIITTYGVGSCLDLVKNGINGFIVSPRNSEALYGSIKKIIGSECLQKNMSKKSLQIIKNYTYENMASGFLKATLYALKTRKYLSEK